MTEFNRPDCERCHSEVALLPNGGTAVRIGFGYNDGLLNDILDAGAVGDYDFEDSEVSTALDAYRAAGCSFGDGYSALVIRTERRHGIMRQIAVGNIWGCLYLFTSLGIGSNVAMVARRDEAEMLMQMFEAVSGKQ